MPLKHVVANDAQFLQPVFGNAVGGDKRLEMPEPCAAIKVNAKKGGCAAPLFAHEFFQHKPVEYVMGDFRQSMVPKCVKLKCLEKCPVLRDADFGPLASAIFPADGFACKNMGRRHVLDYLSVRAKLPFLKWRKSSEYVRQRG